MKLTRKQIAEGLEQIPIAEIILGAGNPSGQTLTASQIKFAEEMAKGSTKAEAYRRSRPNGRKSKAKPATASRRGQELASNSAIQAQTEAFKMAIEAQKYLLPAHLRALTIHQLTIKALDPDLNPAQQIRCLELIGKMTEVSLFTERREIVHTNTSDSLKDQLLSSLRLAIRSSSAIDVEARAKADNLLAELDDADLLDDDQSPDQQPDQQDQPADLNYDPEGHDDGDLGDPQPPHARISTIADAPPLHSNPDKESPNFANNIPQKNVSLTGVSVTNPSESTTWVSIGSNPKQGEGVLNPGQAPDDDLLGTPPIPISNKK
jgi:hypothetical protein